MNMKKISILIMAILMTPAAYAADKQPAAKYEHFVTPAGPQYTYIENTYEHKDGQVNMGSRQVFSKTQENVKQDANNTNATHISKEQINSMLGQMVPGASVDALQETTDASGRKAWEGKMSFQNSKIGFKIDSNTGEVIKWDNETSVSYTIPSLLEISAGLRKSNLMLNYAKGKANEALSQNLPGATFEDVKVQKIEGKQYYTGKICYGEIKYEFRVDAESGRIAAFDQAQ